MKKKDEEIISNEKKDKEIISNQNLMELENNTEDKKTKENKQTNEIEDLSIRPIKIEDFRKALSEISASVSENAFAISELRRWNEMYGEGGSRKKRSISYII